eukprot:6419895-Lingulodinium_polyedra.AAC.1
MVVVQFVSGILSTRAHSLMWEMLGVPGVLAGLLDPEKQGVTLKTLDLRWRDWANAQEHGRSTTWKKILE